MGDKIKYNGGEKTGDNCFIPHPPLHVPNKKKIKAYKMILSLSCLVALSYSLSHSISCAGFYKFVVRDDVISPAGVRNFGTYDDVFEHVHSVARVRKNWATVAAGAPMDRRPREEEMADAGNGF